MCEGRDIPPKKAADSILSRNKLGPIIFCAPEIGRWSASGAVGILIDELTQGLSSLGLDIYVISPYYERNKKGETGYLARDPAGIKYWRNLNVQVETTYALGIHEGELNGVHLIFLHNA